MDHLIDGRALHTSARKLALHGADGRLDGFASDGLDFGRRDGFAFARAAPARSAIRDRIGGRRIGIANGVPTRSRAIRRFLVAAGFTGSAGTVASTVGALA
jgi:hypothetical protein